MGAGFTRAKARSVNPFKPSPSAIRIDDLPVVDRMAGSFVKLAHERASDGIYVRPVFARASHGFWSSSRRGSEDAAKRYGCKARGKEGEEGSSAGNPS